MREQKEIGIGEGSLEKDGEVKVRITARKFDRIGLDEWMDGRGRGDGGLRGRD